MMQPDLFSSAVLPLFEQHRRDWLESARAVARHLAFQNGSVTIDDVRQFCAPPEGIDPRVCGAVFRTKDFEPTGAYRKSARSACHNRPVAVFRLKEVA